MSITNLKYFILAIDILKIDPHTKINIISPTGDYMRQHIRDQYAIEEAKRGIGWQSHAIPFYLAGRTCKYCGKKLSKYNSNKSACFIHSSRALFDYTQVELIAFKARQKIYKERTLKRKALVV